MAQPPSVISKNLFKPSMSEETIQKAAKKALLPVDEVKIWLGHLEAVTANRKRGAAKAASTRRAKTVSSSANTHPLDTSSLPQMNQSFGLGVICNHTFVVIHSS